MVNWLEDLGLFFKEVFKMDRAGYRRRHRFRMAHPLPTYGEEPVTDLQPILSFRRVLPGRSDGGGSFRPLHLSSCGVLNSRTTTVGCRSVLNPS